MLDKSQVDLWYGTRGPRDAKIVLVGESWGEAEAAKRLPFVGSSGTELERMLANAKIDSSKVLFTNVVADQPKGNETWRFFEPKATADNSKRVGGLAPTALVYAEVTRLYQQILSCPRALVIATGNYALWALSQVTGSKVLDKSNNRLIPTEQRTWVPSGIGDWRGSMWFCQPHEAFFSGDMQHRDWEGLKLLPIYHPAAIMRAWYQRDPTIHDLKRRVPLALANDWRGKYEFWAPPTFEQAVGKFTEWLRRADSGEKPRIAADMENFRKSKLMTCVGFADSAHFAMSIPWVRKTASKTYDSYWTVEQEAKLYHLIRCVVSHPNIEIDGQNFVYDTQYFQRDFGVTPLLTHDTMLHQNTFFPGTPKDLSYLSSLYVHYHWYWKEDAKEWDEKGTIEQLLEYNCLDNCRTWEIGGNQREVTRLLGGEEQFQFKMDTNYLCLRMMNRGVLWDRARSAQVWHELSEALARLESELLQIIPQDWVAPVGKRSKEKGGGPIYWITSDMQQKILFYEILGFKKVRDPKTGNLTTGGKAMGQFKIWYPEFTGLFNRLEDYASVENTMNVLRSQIDSDGRIRCSYNPGGTETHRLSSSKNAFGGGTNLQNLTKGEEDD